MDYVYHYYHKWDHGDHGGQSLPFALLTGPCSCTCFTCLYKLDILLLLIVISLLLMDKITININTSTVTTMMTTSGLPLTSTHGPLISSEMSNIVSSTTEPIPLLSSSSSPSSSLSSSSSSAVKRSTTTTTTTSSSSLSSFVKLNSPLPWESITNSHHGVSLINSERSSPSDPPESLPESLNSFSSYGSLRRRLIKPDISLDFLDSSSSESSSSDDEEEDKSCKRKIRRKISNDTDSLMECNLFNGCANDEHFYRDASLSEETFTNDRLIVHPPPSSIVNCS